MQDFLIGGSNLQRGFCFLILPDNLSTLKAMTKIHLKMLYAAAKFLLFLFWLMRGERVQIPLKRWLASDTSFKWHLACSQIMAQQH